jgi:hypothetical protein
VAAQVPASSNVLLEQGAEKQRQAKKIRGVLEDLKPFTID